MLATQRIYGGMEVTESAALLENIGRFDKLAGECQDNYLQVGHVTSADIHMFIF
jgi:hypothetical protein